jgi:putative oxidoreductase
MKRIINYITNIYPAANTFHFSLLVFRVLLSLEMIYAHGLKKLGVGVTEAEHVPNPLHLPEAFNNLFADAANLFFPALVILGLLTRLSILPILAVTLTG